jgi:hypothetical protein
VGWLAGGECFLIEFWGTVELVLDSYLGVDFDVSWGMLF